MPTLFLKLTKIRQRESGKFVDFNDPTRVWRRPSKKRLRISTNDLYCQKLATQAHSIHFTISHRPTRGSISSYNIAGLISEGSEAVATQIAKNCRRQQPHSHLRPPPRGTPASIIIYLIFPKNSSHWPTFLSLRVWVYLRSNLHKFVKWAPKDASFFASECVLAAQGRSGSSVDDFGTNRKRLYDFLLVRHCDYGPTLHRFWNTVTYWLKIACFCYIFATPLSFGAIAPYAAFGILRRS